MKKFSSKKTLLFLISLQSLSPATTETTTTQEPPAQEQMQLSRQERSKKNLILGLAALANSLEIGTSGFFLSCHSNLSELEKKLYLTRIIKGAMSLLQLHRFYKSNDALKIHYLLLPLTACTSLVSCGLELSLANYNNHVVMACMSSMLSLLNAELILPERLQASIDDTLRLSHFLLGTGYQAFITAPPTVDTNGANGARALSIYDIFNRQNTASLGVFTSALERLLPESQITATTEKKCSVCWSDPAEKIVFLNKDQDESPIQPICAKCLLNLYNHRNYNNPYTNLPLHQTITKWSYHKR